jgi:hypothetical protein
MGARKRAGSVVNEYLAALAGGNSENAWPIRVGKDREAAATEFQVSEIFRGSRRAGGMFSLLVFKEGEFRV